jgi:hypothetical protein
MPEAIKVPKSKDQKAATIANAKALLEEGKIRKDQYEVIVANCK